MWSVTFGPDGHTLASGSSDNTVILWNVATGQPLKRPLTGHTAWVRAVLFSPDGSLLASGDDNGQIILWNGASGEMIGQPFNIGNVGVSSLAFGHTIPVLALGTWYTAPVLMDIDLKSWQQHACRIANRNLSALEWQQYLGDEPYQRTCPDLP